MVDIKTVKATDGTSIDYLDEPIGEGGMKRVYFTADKKSVVAFYKEAQDYTAEERLNKIVTTFSPLNDQSCGPYWSSLYCWPSKVIKDGKLGVLAPRYPEHFFFEAGPMKGKEKEGKWFASAKLRKMIDPSEKGTWLSYFKISVLLSRAVARMHRSGLAHSDLSYKNVLIDPKGGHAAIIDIDGLVVPEKFPPDVLGTPDFIAPEVYKTMKLDLRDPARFLPSVYTDRHALAVLIYMYLLYRHPLRGGKVHDLDPAKDEEMSMGEKALFVEHPGDQSNRPKEKNTMFMPWADVTKIPYKIAGPFLKALFDAAFIDGLHEPKKRPTADQWQVALVKTVDLMQPCGNEKCRQKWFVFDNTSKPACPFCGWQFTGQLPIFNFYSCKKPGQWTSDNHRLMVYTNQYIFPWHVNRRIFPDEKLSENEKKPVGYFVFHKGRWVFVNQKLPDLKDIGENKEVPMGSMVELKDNQQLLLSREEGGRMAFVQMVNA